MAAFALAAASDWINRGNQMTYPPQQQPDPWGRQPDQWGQQPPPPPPQDPWGGGGYDGYGPPPKKSGGKTVAIVLVVIVVLAGAGVGLFFLLRGNKNDQAGPGGLNTADPKSVAVAWAGLYERAYNSDYQDVKADQLKPLMCQSQYAGLDKEQKEADAQRGQASSGSAVPMPDHRKYTLQVGDVKANGDAATAMVTATPQAASTGGSSGTTQTGETRAFAMKKENGGWKVCGPQAGGSGGGSSAPSGGATPPVPGAGGGSSGVPVPSGSMKPLPSGIPLPTH